MTKEVKQVLAFVGLCVLVLITFIIVRRDSKPSQDETILASEVDTKYTYSDMQASNESRKDEYTEGSSTHNAAPEPTNNTRTENTIGYSAEEARIRQVSQNIERHRSVDEIDEQNTSTNHLVSYKRQNSVAEHASSLDEELPTKSVAEQKRSKKGNLFNDSSTESVAPIENEQQYYISAVIHGEQSIREGSQVKLRTTQDFSLDGETIPRNTFIFGQAAISENRLSINISGFKANGTIFRTNMVALDQDGSPGLKLIGGQGEGVTDKAIDVADYSTSSALTNIPVVGSIAQGAREILRNKRTTNAKPIILGSNYKIFLKKI